MIAFLVFIAAMQVTPEPFAGHSAQCLSEIAGLTGQRLDLADDALIRGSAAKASELIRLTNELDQERANLERIQGLQLERLPDRIAAGELPQGSEELYRQQIAEEKARYERRRLGLTSRAPSCAWPALVAAPPA